MKSRETKYRAFLLRVWTTQRGTDMRASVKDVESGEVHSFVNLEHLCEWLNRQARTATPRESVK